MGIEACEREDEVATGSWWISVSVIPSGHSSLKDEKMMNGEMENRRASCNALGTLVRFIKEIQHINPSHPRRPTLIHGLLDSWTTADLSHR